MDEIDIPTGEFTAVTASDPDVIADVAEAGVSMHASLLKAPEVPNATPAPTPEIT